MTGDTLKDRVARLEDFLGAPQSDWSVSLAVQMERISIDSAQMREAFMAHVTEADMKTHEMMQDIIALSDAMKARLASLEEEVAMVKSTAPHAGHNEGGITHKVKIPEPKFFNGERSAKVLENFIWDMEHYFKNAHIPETEKVSIASMYLEGDAKLWWRMVEQQAEQSENMQSLDTWDAVKGELRSQFMPCNSAWMAREALRNLRMGSSIRSYIKEFCSLMLDIQNMAEEDKLFSFMAGLQPWAKQELQRQNVADFQSALAMSERLVDFQITQVVAVKKKEVDKRIGIEPVPGRPRMQGYGGGGYKTAYPVASHQGSNSRNSHHDPLLNKGQFQCYICSGNHYARNCPKRTSIAALLIEESERGKSENSEAIMSSMTLLNALSLEVEDGTIEMYVDVYAYHPDEYSFKSSLIVGGVTIFDEEAFMFVGVDVKNFTMEETEKLAALSTMRMWSNLLQVGRFQLFTKVWMNHFMPSVFQPFKQWSTRYERMANEMKGFNFEWMHCTGRHDRMNKSVPQSMEVIVLSSDEEEEEEGRVGSGQLDDVTDLGSDGWSKFVKEAPATQDGAWPVWEKKKSESKLEQAAEGTPESATTRALSSFGGGGLLHP
ncbi:uncharacterized protein LOC126787821 [Argentina anserina]|uniref:uncharacterized protein LOC126787821 n=1 Tax=Argentina anserina TaxID=57926 RepID=UPI002176338A|nr:uncharacterized protein LOC126787821 [Potentilla anserina]